MSLKVNKDKEEVKEQTSSSSSSSSSTSRTYNSSNNVFSSANNGNYFNSKITAARRGSTQDTITSINQILQERNEEEAKENGNIVHGMSDAEYEEYRQFMYKEYGIVVEQGYNYGNFQNVAVAMGEVHLDLDNTFTMITEMLHPSNRTIMMITEMLYKTVKDI